MSKMSEMAATIEELRTAAAADRLRKMFGEFREGLVLTPGETVEGIEIHEMRGGTAMNENIGQMMPIKATPYEHQKKAFAFAMGLFQEGGDATTPSGKGGKGCALLMEM